MASAQTMAAYAAFQNDVLRSQRNFLSPAGMSVNDQTWAGQDGSATNPTNQFFANGPAGQAIEGKPVSQAQQKQGTRANLMKWALPAVLLLLLIRR